LKQESRGTNAWAREQGVTPLSMVRYMKIPHSDFVKWWFPKRLLRFCCEHMVNFCHEQRFTFIKVGGNGNGKKGQEEGLQIGQHNTPDREA
jgi:hypothetical protein